MISWADLADLTLAAIAFAEGVLLRLLFAESLRLPQLQLNVRMVPKFSLSVLDKPHIVRRKELLARSGIVIFVATKVASQLEAAVFSSAVYALWQKANGALHLVCSGPIDECRRLRDRYQLGVSSIPVLFDARGQSAHAFGATFDRMTAVQFDEGGVIRKIGTLSD